MTLPHFLEITRDLFFCSGARSAWSRGSGSKPSQAERQVRVFISWHFLHPYTSLFHSCSCFLVVKLKLEVTDSKRLNNLFTANGKYNHVTISYVWQSVYTVFDERFNHWDCAQALLFDWSEPQENARISPIHRGRAFSDLNENWRKSSLLA